MDTKYKFIALVAGLLFTNALFAEGKCYKQAQGLEASLDVLALALKNNPHLRSETISLELDPPKQRTDKASIKVFERYSMVVRIMAKSSPKWFIYETTALFDENCKNDQAAELEMDKLYQKLNDENKKKKGQ